MAESVVIIPTYNEIENIERMLDTVLTLTPFHVLIVDDGSRRHRCSVKAKQACTGPHSLARTLGQIGVGYAYIAGFQWALEHGYESDLRDGLRLLAQPQTCRACAKPASTGRMLP